MGQNTSAMTSRIFLVGFMGAGKTTVGRLLAERLGWNFVDLDLEIERAKGLSVGEIFASRGEAWFRAAEHEVLRVVAASPKQIISLGGGTYVDPANRVLIESLGCSVYLDTPFELLLKRIGGDVSRPLASDPSRLAHLFEERMSSYRLARVRVETGDRTPEDIVEEILRLAVDS